MGRGSRRSCKFAAFALHPPIYAFAQVWFHDFPCVTYYRCEELMLCEPPKYSDVVKSQQPLAPGEKMVSTHRMCTAAADGRKGGPDPAGAEGWRGVRHAPHVCGWRRVVSAQPHCSYTYEFDPLLYAQTNPAPPPS